MPYPDISYSAKTGPGKSKYGDPKSENEIRPSIVWIGMPALLSYLADVTLKGSDPLRVG